MGGKTKNHLGKALRGLKFVHVWQLVLILIPLLFLIATLLRLDHLEMVKLRTAVLEADAAENDEEIQKTLVALQEFVVSHIVVNVVESNGIQSITFGTGPFYLEHQYLRAANAAIEAAESTLADDKNPHGNIYSAVAAICQPLAIANGWRWSSPGYLDCWTSELAKYPTSDELQDLSFVADVPPTELYRREFASPIWAPTWAGFLILAALIILLVIVIRILVWFILQIALFFLKKA